MPYLHSGQQQTKESVQLEDQCFVIESIEPATHDYTQAYIILAEHNSQKVHCAHFQTHPRAALRGGRGGYFAPPGPSFAPPGIWQILILTIKIDTDVQ